jgi:transposase InsO family protein
MDGEGRRVDNIFIERLWRSLKYEEVYLKACSTTREAELEIGQCMVFYNEERSHQGLNDFTPIKSLWLTEICCMSWLNHLKDCYVSNHWGPLFKA